MLIRYQGQKPIPYRVQTPIPFISHAERVGELVFSPECEVPNDEWSRFLLEECGDAFLQVIAPSQEQTTETANNQIKTRRTSEEVFEEKVQSTLGRRFRGKAGKWNALYYLHRHKLGERLGIKKLQIGDKVVHWEVVAIAAADVCTKDAPVLWRQNRRKGPKESDEREGDGISGISAYGPGPEATN